ncbi:hypothetical protein NE237_024403 [Protea cynaroides]|uniref:Uncharacterized protein n=1 Tax=Protea cynaroides TaxID=273540 RepID=A0A9Q0HIH2_9MAGN|nr:hypothetical protein NE237_024403 [Protea cynaroides]
MLIIWSVLLRKNSRRSSSKMLPGQSTRPIVSGLSTLVCELLMPSALSRRRLLSSWAQNAEAEIKRLEAELAESRKELMASKGKESLYEIETAACLLNAFNESTEGAKWVLWTLSEVLIELALSIWDFVMTKVPDFNFSV